MVPAALAAAWPLLDVRDLSGTTPRLAAAVLAIVTRYGAASGAAALGFYRQHRLAEAVKSPLPQLRTAPAASASTVVRMVDYATGPLYGPPNDAAVHEAQSVLNGSATNLVLDQSRRTVLDAVHRDPAAKGWARVTGPDACSFCVMLALRAGVGFLYRKEDTADFKAHMPHLKGGKAVGGICRCHVEPVFTAFEPSHRMREAQGLWESSTKGLSGSDARNAFRTALNNQ